ncbi:MAG: zinc-ribbon domain-containing protein [Limisphaerales bacterium]
MTPDLCPNCGAEVPKRARACPECGADEQTGWSEQAAAAGLDLPDEEFDYDGFVQEEFGRKKPLPHGAHWIWWVVAVAMVALLVFLWAR